MRRFLALALMIAIFTLPAAAGNRKHRRHKHHKDHYHTTLPFGTYPSS